MSVTDAAMLSRVERELSLALVALGQATAMFDEGMGVIDPSCGAMERLAALHADVAAHCSAEGCADCGGNGYVWAPGNDAAPGREVECPSCHKARPWSSTGMGAGWLKPVASPADAARPAGPPRGSLA